MGKNGGESTGTSLTLEEALRSFKRKRDEVSSEVRGEGEETAASDLESADDSANAFVQRDEANAGISASADLVAVIDGIPRTLEELERLAAADQAYAEDFPETAPETVEVEDDAEAGDIEVAVLANRHALIRDYAFTAMGTALMVLVAVLVMRVPIVNSRPNLMAQSVATAALKTTAPMSAEDLISTWVMIPDTDVQLASARSVKSDQLEARVKDALRLRAFPDIGVSVSKMGDAYLAGEVYSLDEALKIKQIVHRVNGISRVHFLHPDVHSAQGPAYFGVTTAWAPDVWGAKVKAVIIGSPADKAGIHPGDVISEFDGQTVPDAKALNEVVAQHVPGQRVQFRVWHDGQPEYLVARLGEVTTVASR
ncbi:MAG: PDZ domain-containing protein [Candidatus Binatus sp.]